MITRHYAELTVTIIRPCVVFPGLYSLFSLRSEASQIGNEIQEWSETLEQKNNESTKRMRSEIDNKFEAVLKEISSIKRISTTTNPRSEINEINAKHTAVRVQKWSWLQWQVFCRMTFSTLKGVLFTIFQPAFSTVLTWIPFQFSKIFHHLEN